MPAFTSVRLRDIRRQQGLTQRAIAEQIGKARRTYLKYESGEITPSATVVGRLAGVFGCSVADLFTASAEEFTASADEGVAA